MIFATETDRPAVEAFLNDHIATSMFPLSNLRRYGMAGGHDRAVRFWVKWQAGSVTDVLTLTEGGFVFPNCPNAPWEETRVVLAGTQIAGLLGHGAQVTSLRRVLALPDAAGVDTVEPLYELSLEDLQLPDLRGFTLGPLSAAPQELVVGWRRSYLEEVFPMPGEDFQMRAEEDFKGYTASDSHRVLYQDGVPVAMTGFNAVLSEAVQIGGVYTPPALRNRGLARRAVAMHLAEARENGVRKAILFAASTQAARAYEAVGFTRVGDFAVVLFEKPQVVNV